MPLLVDDALDVDGLAEAVERGEQRLQLLAHHRIVGEDHRDGIDAAGNLGRGRGVGEILRNLQVRRRLVGCRHGRR